jgi:uncharacterized membrane protein
VDDIETNLSQTSRVEAFSDGVMAIAITLLVLDVRLPDGDGDLWRQLLHLWPSYLAYFDSFVAIGVIWMCHHTFFSRLARVDAALRWANLALLLTVSFIPFPTAVLARHLGTPGANARVAAAFFGVAAMAQAVAWLLMWAAVLRRPTLLRPGMELDFVRRQRHLAVIGIAVFAACTLVSALAPMVAVSLYVVAIVGFGLTSDGIGRPGTRAARASATAE